MSSPLQRLNLGRKPVAASDREAMLSRLGIAEEKPRDLFREPEPEPAAEPEPPAQPALARAPDPEHQPEPARPESWDLPANDEHIPPPPAEAFRPEPAAAPPPASQAAPPSFRKPRVEEDPIEAIRRQYRKAAMPLPRPDFQLPHVQLPNVQIPNIQFNVPRAGERRRKYGELGSARRLIWGASIVAAVIVGAGLLFGDESNAIVQAFGALLP